MAATPSGNTSQQGTSFSSFSLGLSTPQPKSYVIIWQISRHVQYYQYQFNRSPLKELHQLVPRLLSSIFGYDSTAGWRLKQCHRTKHQKEFDAGLQFLSPKGPLFQVLTKLDENGFQYEFPIKCLPYASQLSLKEGIIPLFYQGKVQLSFGSNQQVPDHICLSAFEYYLFHFAYYLQEAQTGNTSQSHIPWSPLQDCLYTALLDSYLSHYLPLIGPLPSHNQMGGATGGGVSPLSTPPTNKGHTHLHGTSSPIVGHTPLGLLKMNGNGMGGASMTTPFQQSDMGMLHTETLLQVLVEFWLNDTPHSLSPNKRFSLTMVASCSQEHVRCIRMLIKHVLYFTNGSSFSSPLSSPVLSSLNNITETLRQSVIPLFFRKQVYQFISNAFKHWPLDDTFRYVLELWLTYIQPWRYTDPSKPSAENKENFEKLPKKWRSYILENLPFYTTLFLSFFGRSFQLDLTSNLGVNLLSRVAKVFAQPGLAEIMRNGEELLLSNGVGVAHADRGGGLTPSSIKNIFEILEGPSFQYQSLFDLLIYEALQVLFDNIGQAKSQLSTTNPQDGTSAPNENRSWLSSLWHDLFDSAPDDSPAKPVNPVKLIQCLEISEKNFRNFFQLPGGDNLNSSFFKSSWSFDGSPSLHPSSSPLSPSSSQLGHYVDHTHLATPPASIEAEYEEGSCKLTPEGREQVKSGLRICNKSRVTLIGDPLLQPIRSYENTLLVRFLYKLSSYLNDKFSTQLSTIGSSQRLFHKLLLQFLAPPLQSSRQQTTPPTTPTSRTSRRGPILSNIDTRPRISLRAFGSYYTLGYILFSLLFVWALSVPLLLVVTVLLLILVIYPTVRYYMRS